MAQIQMQQVPKSGWRQFFDVMGKAVLGKSAEVEVASLEVGDQIIAEWVPMRGITYDSRDDLLDVALDRGSHLIRRPQDILVDESESGLSIVAVVDADGVRHIIRLKEPLLLPPATAQR
jgi:Family of unknown function (DUF5335)